MDGTHLSHLLDQAAARRPAHPAVEDEQGRTLSYAALARAADRLSTRLARWGVGRGDRVGLFLPKGLEAVAALHGVLRSGAAYVPADPSAPVPRGAGVFADAGVKAVVVDAALAPALRAAWHGPGPCPRLIVVGAAKPSPSQIGQALGMIHPPPQPSPTRGEGAIKPSPLVGEGWVGGPGRERLGSYGENETALVGAASDLDPRDALWEDVLADDAPSPLLPIRQADDLAYLLYTSGSTGRPKGVMLSHANAFTFLDWCDRALGPWSDTDRYSSHAPFHFDLSVFDLFVSCRHAGTLVLIGEALGKDPARLGAFLADRRVSVWYSAPSILSLLTNYGGLDRSDFPAPRLVLFAGEVFPIAPLKRLRGLWPEAALWNLYGPTETNVCTAQPIPATIPDEQTVPFPIGAVCPPLRARVVDEHGNDLPPGSLGELVIAGPGVMRGYFGRPDLTARAFFRDSAGVPWYRTGDLVSDDGTGCHQFHGRRDRMVKKRGYRIELGEIEAALYRHDGVDRAAVIARTEDSGVSIAAFLALKPGHKGSVIALKRHCAAHLPSYMIPDTITFLSDLPTTSTDKVDYQGLNRLALSRV